MDGLSPDKKSAFENYATELIGDIGVLNNSVNKLKAELPSLLQQIAAGANEVARIQTTVKKTAWVVIGALSGLAVFGLGVTYGSIHATWHMPAWINQGSIISELSSSLLRAPVGGVGFFMIGLTLIFLHRSISDSIAKNNEDKIAIKIFVYLAAAAFTATGCWLSFFMMFR